MHTLPDFPVDPEDAPCHVCLRIKQPVIALVLLVPIVVMDTGLWFFFLKTASLQEY